MECVHWNSLVQLSPRITETVPIISVITAAAPEIWNDLRNSVVSAKSVSFSEAAARYDHNAYRRRVYIFLLTYLLKIFLFQHSFPGTVLRLLSCLINTYAVTL